MIDFDRMARSLTDHGVAFDPPLPLSARVERLRSSGTRAHARSLGSSGTPHLVTAASGPFRVPISSEPVSRAAWAGRGRAG